MDSTNVTESPGTSRQPTALPKSIHSNSNSSKTSIASVEKTWNARKDPFTGQITTLRNDGIDLVGQTPKEKAENFIQRYANEIFQIDPKDLILTENSTNDRFTFQHRVNGYKVYGSTLTLYFEGEDFHLAKSRLSLVSDKGNRAFDLAGSAAGPVLKDAVNTPELVLYPHQGNGIWSFLAVTKEPGEQYWQVLVDANSGHVISKIDLIKY